MNAFDDAWIAAQQAVARTLAEAGVDSRVRADVLGLLRRASLPGRLTLLGSARGGSGVTGEAFLGVAAAQAAGQSELDAEEVSVALRRLLRGEQGTRASPVTERLALAAVARALVTQGIPVDPSDVETAVRLLRSGGFHDDMAQVSATILRTVSDLPDAVVEDVAALPSRPTRLLEAVVGDVAALLGGGATAFVRALRKQESDEGTPMLANTLSALYDLAVPGKVVAALRALLSSENESFRLAVLIYARANGIPLQPEHLDFLRDRVLDTDEPDLAPILRAAAEQWLASLDHGAIVEMLHGLSKRPA